MHCISKIIKEFCTVRNGLHHLVKSVIALSEAKAHDRVGLSQTSAQLHHLARHDLACCGSGNDSLEVADISDHRL